MKQRKSNVRYRLVGTSLWVLLGLTTFFSSMSMAGSAQRDDDRLTVIGCIKRSEADVPSTPGTTAIMSDQTRYVLTNITLSGRDAPTKDTGPSPAPLIAQNVKMYRLDDSAAGEIAAHVGERVEVTGILVKEPNRPTGTTGRIDQTPPVAQSPLLKVQSLKTISADSASCTQ